MNSVELLKNNILLNYHDNASTFFIPVYGLGDKIRFFSYLYLYEHFNDCKPIVVIGNDESEKIIKLYPNLLQNNCIVVDSKFLPNNQTLIDFLPYFDDIPRAGAFFPTWHRTYRNWTGVKWESIGNGVSHDLQIKNILNIPWMFKPQKIEILNVSDIFSKRIYVAPCCNSSYILSESFWISLLDLIAGFGIEIILNFSNSNEEIEYSKKYPELVKKYDAVKVTVFELMNLVKSSLGIITLRSGLADIFSLTDARCITINHMTNYWDIPNYFGKHHEIKFENNNEVYVFEKFKDLFLNTIVKS